MPADPRAPDEPPAPEPEPLPDPVEEASEESFPASDPPGWTPLHIGGPGRHPPHARVAVTTAP